LPYLLQSLLPSDLSYPFVVDLVQNGRFRQEPQDEITISTFEIQPLHICRFDAST